MKVIVKFIDKICWYASMAALLSIAVTFIGSFLTAFSPTVSAVFVPLSFGVTLFLFGFLALTDDISSNYKKKNKSIDYPNKKACRVVSFVEPKSDSDFEKEMPYPIYEIIDGLSYNIKGDMRVERAVYPEGTAFEVWFSEDMQKNYTPDLDSDKKITHGKLIAGIILIVISIFFFFCAGNGVFVFTI